MRCWSAQRVADAAGAELLAANAEHSDGPARAAIDSRVVLPGDLFVGLAGARTDGGEHAEQALAAHAWGVLLAPAHARRVLTSARSAAVLAHSDPLAGLQALAAAWAQELRAGGARSVAITGSTGKTSTKDILAALLAARLRTHSSRENQNTEIGLPLSLLAAPEGTEALVLELAMRGPGQIAQLTAIARPDVGVIVNIGPAHIELLGSLAAIAAAKAELIAGLAPGATLVVPAREPLLEPYLREDLEVVRFGAGGDVELLSRESDGTLVIRDRGEELRTRPSFAQAHNLQNLLAAVAAAGALGVRPPRSLAVSFSSMRGQRHELPGGVVLIEDCYNANPMSMRAAIADLAESSARRRVAVLGDMLELGSHGQQMHREIGTFAAEQGIDALIAVGPLAAGIAEGFGAAAERAADAEDAARRLPALLREGDTVLVKASRGVGLERVVGALLECSPLPGVQASIASGRR